MIASNSTFAYRDKTPSATSARAWSRACRQGSVQRADGRVRIDVSLVDTRDDTALWSERYSRELTDVLTCRTIFPADCHTLSDVRRRPAAKSPSLATQIRTPTTPICACLAPQGTPSTTTAGARTRLWTATRSSNGPWLRIETSHWRVPRSPARTRSGFSTRTPIPPSNKGVPRGPEALAINPDPGRAYLARAQLTWNLRNGFPPRESHHRPSARPVDQSQPGRRLRGTGEVITILDKRTRSGCVRSGAATGPLFSAPANGG